MEQINYVHLIPNSHSFGSLENILSIYSFKSEEVNEEYFLIGFRNTLKRGWELKQIKEVDGKQGPCFTSVDSIIQYLETDYDEKMFVIRIEHTLKNGLDLKCERKMERTEVYKRLDTERDYQDLRWSTRRTANGTPDEEKPPAEWINYIEYHVSAAKNEVYNLNTEEALAHVRKVAALAVRCLELHGCPERIIPKELLNLE